MSLSRKPVCAADMILLWRFVREKYNTLWTPTKSSPNTKESQVRTSPVLVLLIILIIFLLYFVYEQRLTFSEHYKLKKIIKNINNINGLYFANESQKKKC